MYLSKDRQVIRASCRNLTVALPSGERIPRLGQGTCFMGEDIALKANEIKALQLGVDLGMTLIDTAEMYGEGLSEQLIGEALRGVPRENLFLISKVYPYHAGRHKIFTSCKNSLQRLGVDYLDMYLLHWRGDIPLAETVWGMEKLVREGYIRYWGVSNFDTADMSELWEVPDGPKCAANQVLYYLGSRNIEFDLLPWLKEHQVPCIAYCPLGQAGTLRNGLLNDREVLAVAEKYHVTPMQVLLSFVLYNENVIAIPKAALPEHVLSNAQAALFTLTTEDMADLAKSYPVPVCKNHFDSV